MSQDLIPTTLSVRERKSLLERIDAVVESHGGVPSRGIIPQQRDEHASEWHRLLAKDRKLRAEILNLKGRENQVLTIIRDRVMTNLVDTVDTAMNQGLLSPRQED